MSKVQVHVARTFVFSPPAEKDARVFTERTMLRGVHELDPENDEADRVFLNHKWIKSGAEGFIDLRATKMANPHLAGVHPFGPSPEPQSVSPTPPVQPPTPPVQPPTPPAGNGKNGTKGAPPDPLADLRGGK